MPISSSPEKQLTLFQSIKKEPKHSLPPHISLAETTAREMNKAEAKKTKSKSKRLQLALQSVFDTDFKLVLTDNRSILLSSSRKKGLLHLRVHQMFLDASDEVMTAVAAFMRSRPKHSAAIIDEYVKSQQHLLSLHAPALSKDAAQGQAHDLKILFDEVNLRYFSGKMSPELTWGLAGSFKGRKRRSIVLGSYDSRAHRITIHPALDHKDVPSVVIERILHHEFLHILYPIKTQANGRRIVHSKEFRKAEALFTKAAEADRWIDAHLDFILKFRPKVLKGGTASTGVKSSKNTRVPREHQ